jgi:hypothetical protein
LHDWSGKYAAQILKNIVPAMDSNSRILLTEFIVPPSGAPVPKVALRMLAGIDMQMAVACNSMERTPADWERVVKMTDERLMLKQCHIVPGNPLGIVEIVLKE